MKAIDLFFYMLILCFVVINIYVIHTFNDINDVKVQLLGSTGMISLLTYMLMRVRSPRKPEKFKLLLKA